MKFLSTWLRNVKRNTRLTTAYAILNEVPEHMAQEYEMLETTNSPVNPSSMKFLSTWLRNCRCPPFHPASSLVLNEVPEHMAQESRSRPTAAHRACILNEVPKHMAQELCAPDGRWTPFVPQ